MSEFMQVSRWDRFCRMVRDHIEQYVIPQYGDENTEPAKEYDFDDCIKQSQRYLARTKTTQRPHERGRDLLKAAHWIQKAWDRLPERNRNVLSPENNDS